MVRVANFLDSSEITCDCCGNYSIHNELAVAWEKFRETMGFPIKIVSGYRCAETERQMGAKNFDDSPHYRGTALDLAVSSFINHQTNPYSDAVLTAAIMSGFTGIGRGNGHLHLDVAHVYKPSMRPYFWTYDGGGKMQVDYVAQDIYEKYRRK